MTITDRQDFYLATLVVLLLMIVVFLGIIAISPEPPRHFEIQQALDNYAFQRGWCPAYSELVLFEDRSWTCHPK